MHRTDAKQLLAGMRVGERLNVSSEPCYPVWVERAGEGRWVFPGGQECSLEQAARRLEPVGLWG